MTASGREHPKGCESKYSTYSQIPYQQSTRIQLHVPKRTPAGAPPGGAALPFMSPTTRTLSILTGPHPRGRPRSPRQAAVRSSARRPSPRAGRGPPALAQVPTRSRGCATPRYWGGYPFGAGSALTLLQQAALGRSRHGRACEAPVPPVQPMLSPLPPLRLARHLASPQGSSLAPAASLCRSPAPAPPTSCTATRDAPPSRTACIRYSRRAFATTWIACHCKRARSRAVKVCRAG